jgi:hypothetical protein
VGIRIAIQLCTLELVRSGAKVLILAAEDGDTFEQRSPRSLHLLAQEGQDAIRRSCSCRLYAALANWSRRLAGD